MQREITSLSGFTPHYAIHNVKATNASLFQFPKNNKGGQILFSCHFRHQKLFVGLISLDLTTKKNQYRPAFQLCQGEKVSMSLNVHLQATPSKMHDLNVPKQQMVHFILHFSVSEIPCLPYHFGKIKHIVPTSAKECLS